MVIPFLFEMRAVMDWIWTDTSMTVMDWFKMEDIFANIYQIKVNLSLILCVDYVYLDKIFLKLEKILN
jgi:hypothetical protein